jgi:hypothetical protein
LTNDFRHERTETFQSQKKYLMNLIMKKNH